MKAVIPVAGAGTRLRPHTYTQPKPLIPVAGKTIISFIVDQLLKEGVREFVFIIGYLGEKIQLYLEKTYPKLDKKFVHQTSREGSAHAIWMAKNVIEDASEIIIVFGDTIIDVNMQEFLGTPHSCIGVNKVKDPRQFGVVELNDSGFIKRMV